MCARPSAPRAARTSRSPSARSRRCCRDGAGTARPAARAASARSSDPEPNSATHERRDRLDRPGHVPPGRRRRDDRRAQRGQPEAVPAVQRVQVPRAATDHAGSEPRRCAPAPSRCPRCAPTIQPARITNGLADGGRAGSCGGRSTCRGRPTANASREYAAAGACAPTSRTCCERCCPPAASGWPCRHEGALRPWAHESP